MSSASSAFNKERVMTWMFSGLLAVLLTVAPAMAKDFSSWRKYSKGELLAETTAFTPGRSGTVGFYITLADHWHTYWVNPGDSGTAIRLHFKNSPGLKVQSVHLPRPKRFQTGPLISFGYEKEVLLLAEVDVGSRLKPGDTARMEVEAEWLVCEDVCIPAFDTLKLEIPIRALADVQPGPHFTLFQKARSDVPHKVPALPKWSDKNGSVELALDDFSEDEFIDFFPFRGSGVTNAKPELISQHPMRLKFVAANVPREMDSRVGVLVSRNKSTGREQATQFGESGWAFTEEGGRAQQSLWWMLLSAFIGGLILNLMPCVFPILSMKLLSLLKLSSAHRSDVRVQNFAYVAGVLVSFLVIALLLSALRSAGHLVGWGFQLQSPVFLSLLCWLFFVLSLNLLGVFEIDFLNAGFGHRLTRLGGIWGSFFTGILAVIVASPCTAPFMGAALGFGLTQSTAYLFATFLMLGLGLAFPYLLFAIFPAWISVLPKPGRWMNLVKQVMAFPLLATTVWLLWILSQVRGTNAVFVVLAGCVAIGFALWLSAWGKRLAKILAAAIIAGGLVYIYQGERQVKSAVESDVWAAYSDSLLEGLRGKNVFVNMTADWCLTCKVNENLVFDDPEVLKLLKVKNVELVKGDWTQRNEEITRFLSRFDRVGVPFYVLYSPQHPDGLVLPEVLTKSSFIELIQKEFP